MAGLALIVLGTAMVGIAAARFVRIAKNIDREACVREQDRGSTLRLRGCWCFWVALYSFICPTPLSPTSEARFRDDAPGNLDSDKNRMDEAWK
jgi:hypothetical protein